MNSTNKKTILSVTALIMFFILIIVAMQASRKAFPVTLAAPEAAVETTSWTEANPTQAGASNCRYGATPVETHSSPEQVLPISELGAGWYLIFSPFRVALEPANDAEFVHILDLHQDRTGSGGYLDSYTLSPPLTDSRYTNALANHPGEIWIIGNEVDRLGRGDTFPDVYAKAYHDIYHFIKSHDPTARVANAAMVEATPGRMQYLDMMWDSYIEQYGVPMPVDVWTMHLYVLPEVEFDGTPNNIASVAVGTDPALGKRGSNGDPANCPADDVYCYAEHDDMSVFAEQVVTMRRWMADHKVQNKPLLLTEYSVLYPFEDDGGSCFLQDEFGNCFTPQRVSDFMLNVFSYLSNAKDPAIGYPLDDNRLIQQWSWFAIHTDKEGTASNLYESDLVTQTLMGQTFANHVNNEAATVNLIVDEVQAVIGDSGGMLTATVDLSVQFRNNGNSSITAPYNVSFYEDAAHTQLIGTAAITPTLRGCAAQVYSASVSWAGLAPGAHPYYIVLDSGHVIAETPSNDVDNVGSGLVLINPAQVLLPVVQRP